MRIPYSLRDPGLMRRIMEHPGRGTAYSTRSLADAAGVSPSIIGHLLSGRRTDANVDHAHRIAEALGVAVLVLFAPPASPKSDVSIQNLDTLQEEL